MDRPTNAARAKAAPPRFVPPMLARRVHKLPEGPGWSYEVKFDGYRMQAIKSATTMRLLSRNEADYTARFRQVAQTVAKLKADSLVLDGEVVAVEGRPSFQILQKRAKLPPGWAILYYAFDLLLLNGQNLCDQPLSQQRRQFARVLKGSSIRLSATLDADAVTVIKAVEAQGVEAWWQSGLIPGISLASAAEHG